MLHEYRSPQQAQLLESGSLFFKVIRGLGKEGNEAMWGQFWCNVASHLNITNSQH